jgi:hypothetical protein
MAKVKIKIQRVDDYHFFDVTGRFPRKGEGIRLLINKKKKR